MKNKNRIFPIFSLVSGEASCLKLRTEHFSVSGWCPFYDASRKEMPYGYYRRQEGGRRKGDMQKRYAVQRECYFVYARVNPQVKDKHSVIAADV